MKPDFGWLMLLFAEPIWRYPIRFDNLSRRPCCVAIATRTKHCGRKPGRAGGAPRLYAALRQLQRARHLRTSPRRGSVGHSDHSRERISGRFEPLRFFPKTSRKKVVLGLISTKLPALEAKDEFKRRIDAAAKYVPHENLCLSPQCGFASNFRGNPVTEDVQRRKLELAVQVASEIWGTAE
ncbi:MAG: hypothetical protein HY246_21710 [Proteobacteria bacterium]|nr:hypothetical protein [Pseudomonadota bacterium]